MEVFCHIGRNSRQLIMVYSIKKTSKFLLLVLLNYRALTGSSLDLNPISCFKSDIPSSAHLSVVGPENKKEANASSKSKTTFSILRPYFYSAQNDVPTGYCSICVSFGDPILLIYRICYRSSVFDFLCPVVIYFGTSCY